MRKELKPHFTSPDPVPEVKVKPLNTLLNTNTPQNSFTIHRTPPPLVFEPIDNIINWTYTLHT